MLIFIGTHIPVQGKKYKEGLYNLYFSASSSKTLISNKRFLFATTRNGSVPSNQYDIISVMEQ